MTLCGVDQSHVIAFLNFIELLISFCCPLVKQKVVMLAHMLLKVITKSTSSMFVDSVDLSSLMIGSKHLSFITFSYSLPKMEPHDMTQLK